ncbi:MAG TPA: hypothetical protein VFF98_11270 [Novosphingobium sp.]|nr:hypothetical protein [Novosphingobium sp.]
MGWKAGVAGVGVAALAVVVAVPLVRGHGAACAAVAGQADGALAEAVSARALAGAAPASAQAGGAPDLGQLAGLLGADPGDSGAAAVQAWLARAPLAGGRCVGLWWRYALLAQVAPGRAHAEWLALDMAALDGAALEAR